MEQVTWVDSRILKHSYHTKTDSMIITAKKPCQMYFRLQILLSWPEHPVWSPKASETVEKYFA